jgi:hypothetical protein
VPSLLLEITSAEAAEFAEKRPEILGEPGDLCG